MSRGVSLAQQETIEIPISGMDCMECTQHVQHAISALAGVESADVYLAAQKAVVRLDASLVSVPAIRKAVEAAGYGVPEPAAAPERQAGTAAFTRSILVLFGVAFGVVLFVIVVGEWLGLFEAVTGRVPWPIGLAVVLIAGYPVFRNVISATLQRQVISHTLMTLGVLAALAVGQWATAAVVVLFMRVGDYAERFTTERARHAVKDLTALAPPLARVERDGQEIDVPASQVRSGETVIVRPGEKIPVDGEVTGGQATMDQAALTGESMPVEAGPGMHVYAATLVRLGSLRIRTTHVGPDTTFGRVVKMVEEAEAHRADVQRVADKFSGYYLPVVAAVAALTFLLRRDPLATAAVLVVACSCSFALATPIAMLASIGAAARHGLLVKGGKYLEALAGADVLLIDKTGTLTLGRPRITDIVSLDGISQNDLLVIAASAERYSEHPLAEAVRTAARQRGLDIFEPERFESLPGLGVRADINGRLISVGNLRMAGAPAVPAIGNLQAEGKSLLLVMQDGRPLGVLAAADTLRPEVPAALAALASMGMGQIELLTGDNEQTAASLAHDLGVRYRANLLPEDKIAVVKEYQSQGHVVVMIGDGVNDAPALAQANVGIVMAVSGSDVAIEAGHIALMRDDWSLVPEVVRIARRTMRVVKANIAFTTVYNIIGLSLASLGFLPPIFAAVAQSLPDLGILANSSRLLRQK
jgi:P-type Cu+ transporter